MAKDFSYLLPEVEFSFARASGPGGQHVNKTDSAVWIYHRPTGIRLKVDQTRSQFQNKQIALERLAAELLNRVQARRQAIQSIQHKRRAKIRPRKVKNKILQYKKKNSEKKAARKKTFED